ncbi:hypothetical protein O3M35_000599 [Rhynocoris fuscipes]|uniref:Uncharacterized protein n=1 Tax=Rhynocoris fuscipes TaxID=488301 RepID=A0AAW1DT39_9HEMI
MNRQDEENDDKSAEEEEEEEGGEVKTDANDGGEDGKKVVRVHFPPDVQLADVKIVPVFPKKETAFKKIKRKCCCVSSPY